MKRTELVVLLLILAIAAGMRLYGLSTTPPGLYPDEAMNGNNALEANRTGTYKLFYPENNGREGLFINIQAASVAVFGNTTFALRFVSALFGVLTVLGVYLLTRRMFDDWRVAAIAAFLMSVGFWHVNFSRIGFRAIMAPLCAVWGFYYLYKGIETHRLWSWALAGVWFGIGFHTYIAYRVIPLAIAFTLGAYWLSLRAAFSHSKYTYARHQMLGGVAMMIGISLIVILPMVAYFYANPSDLVGRTGQVAVWASEQPIIDFLTNAGRTFGMFFFQGDFNWRHNIAGAPILFWPVAVFFMVGLLHTWWKFMHSFLRRGHPGIVHTLLLSWFVVGLLPALLSTEGSPHALRALVVAPAVYIMSAVGLHWLYLWLERWYGAHDHRQVCIPARFIPGSHGEVCAQRSTIIVTCAVVSLLLALGVADGSRYFVDWGRHPEVSGQFNGRYTPIAQRLNELPPATLKYVVVKDGSVLVDGIYMQAQTVMYLTDTWKPAQQRAKNIYYITPQEFSEHKYPKGAIVVQLDP